MRRILVKSLNEAFDFVMDHYYPAGCEEDAKRKDTIFKLFRHDKRIDRIRLIHKHN